MADKNLTGAILGMNDQKNPSLPPKRKKRVNPPERQDPYRPRAFDMFFAFAAILLGLALVSQAAAMFAFL